MTFETFERIMKSHKQTMKKLDSIENRLCDIAYEHKSLIKHNIELKRENERLNDENKELKAKKYLACYFK